MEDTRNTGLRDRRPAVRPGRGGLPACWAPAWAGCSTPSREETIRNLTQVMKGHRTSHYLRSELGLIGNMARTIPENGRRAPG